MPSRILIVDDEHMVRDLLDKTLKLAGYETAVAADGAAALEEMKSRHYDLAIADVVMPGISGLDLLKTIQRDHPGTRVVILTGHPRKIDISDFLLHGADEFVTKPFRTDELLALVERVLDDEEESVPEDGAT
jgi:DNA-binding response OmpR family regulator